MGAALAALRPDGARLAPPAPVVDLPRPRAADDLPLDTDEDDREPQDELNGLGGRSKGLVYHANGESEHNSVRLTPA